MDQFEREVVERLKTIEIKLDSYNEIKRQVYKNKDDIKSNTEDIKLLKEKLDKEYEHNKWLKRTFIAAIITATISAIIGIVSQL